MIGSPVNGCTARVASALVLRLMCCGGSSHTHKVWLGIGQTYWIWQRVWRVMDAGCAAASAPEGRPTNRTGTQYRIRGEGATDGIHQAGQQRRDRVPHLHGMHGIRRCGQGAPFMDSRRRPIARDHRIRLRAWHHILRHGHRIRGRHQRGIRGPSVAFDCRQS